MSRAARVALALAATLAFTAIALLYPWLAREDAWIGASWQNKWLLLPLVVVHGREVVEAVDDARWSAMASVLAHRK